MQRESLSADVHMWRNNLRPLYAAVSVLDTSPLTSQLRTYLLNGWLLTSLEL